MAWFLRAIEQQDGEWRCSHGRTVFDQHDSLPDALQHLRTIGETMRPADLIIHWLDGGINNTGPV
jgi:hypothetical protein